MSNRKIETKYFSIEIETTGGIRRQKIKKILITKKEYRLELETIEILEFLTIIRLFLRKKLKKIGNYKTMFFKDDEIKLQAGDVIFSIFDCNLLAEIFIEFRKIYEII